MRFLLTLAVALGLAGPLRAQTYPDPISPFVNDYIGLLDTETAARIEAALIEMRETGDWEVTLVVINSRLTYGPSASIKAFGTGLFNYWGVGDPAKNDGMMIVVAVQDRDLRIVLGAGYPQSFDKRSETVIDQSFLPRFRDGAMVQGIEEGTIRALERLRPGAPEETSLSRALGSGWLAWLLGILGVGGVGGAGLLAYSRRPARCRTCGHDMVLLSEVDDDAHLSLGQQVEERIGSINHNVWRCRQDDQIEIIGRRRWFTRFRSCPNCGFRTYHGQRTVLNAATTSQSGTARVDYTCRNCEHRDSELVTIPMISQSSGSSSGGGSFSGGSSSGGGGSGSW